MVLLGLTIMTIPAKPKAMASQSCLLMRLCKKAMASSGMKIGVVFSNTFAFIRLVIWAAAMNKRNPEIPVAPRSRCMGNAAVLRSRKRRAATMIVTTTRALKKVTQLNISTLISLSIALPKTLWMVLAKKASTMKIAPNNSDCFGCACMFASIVIANLGAVALVGEATARRSLSPDTVDVIDPPWLGGRYGNGYRTVLRGHLYASNS